MRSIETLKIISNPNFDATAFPYHQMISDEIINKIYQFHQSLSNYSPTKTHSLTHLSEKYSLRKIFVKDESSRFDLKAFKVLGASYAMATILAEFLGLDEISFDKIYAQRERYKDLIFATTTDGNHGRAVAWSAYQFGCKAVVYMPKGSSLNRLNAIKAYAATAHISELGYDDCVLTVNKLAKQNGWELIQDTAWEGYEDIPMRIMQGYFTLLSEFLQQFDNAKSERLSADWPTHVFVQAGVGTLAAAIALAFRHYSEFPFPKIIVMEPKNAACFFESVKYNDGSAHRIEGDLNTMMAGLACGEPSIQAWKILKQLAFAFAVCEDEIAFDGMRLLASPILTDETIVSGESAAVGLGLITELMNNPQYKSLSENLDLNSQSKILLFSTEGDTDSEIYQQILNNSI